VGFVPAIHAVPPLLTVEMWSGVDAWNTSGHDDLDDINILIIHDVF